MARRRRRRRRRTGNWFARLSVGKKVGVCLGGLLLALAASGVVFAASKLSMLDTQDIADDIVINEEVANQDLGTGYLNVALFGVDSRDGQLDKGTRTDCIIVGSLNKETKEIKMVSVYRDTLLDIDSGQLQKCNAAYAFGGPTQAINMLNKNLDLNIEEFVTVDWGAIANAIDLLGGVTIDVQEEEIQYLNKFVGETAKAAGKKAHKVKKAGEQKLDGVQATTYARIRSTAGGDFTRTERQRLVVEKIIEQVQKSDLSTLNKVIDEVLPTIKTSFTAQDILYYAKSYSEYKLVDNEGFPFDKTTDTITGLGSIVIPVTLESNVAKLHEFLFGSEEYSVSGTVSSLSSAIVSRVGQRTATDDTTLKQQTYKITEEDRAQEKQTYDTGSNNSTSGSTSGESSSNGSSSGGNSSGGNSSGSGSSSNTGDTNSGNTNTGGNTGSGSGSGGSSSGGSSSGGSDSSGGGSSSGGSSSGGSSSGGSSSGGSDSSGGGSSSGGSSSGGSDSGGGGSSSGSGSNTESTEAVN